MTERTKPTAHVTRLNTGGHRGKLTTANGEQVPVRVFERGEDVLMLVLLLDSGDELQADPDKLETTSVKPLLLEYISANGVVRFRGEAELEEPDLVRFHAVDDPDVVQRREFVRVETSQPVVVAPGPGATIGTHAVDISGGGMLLNGPETLGLNSELRFEIQLQPDEAPVAGVGRVVRASTDGKRAIVFKQLSGRDRQRLIRFVFDRQRAALAKTRGYQR